MSLVPPPTSTFTATHLPGCTPTPLAAYLKALGILRLVAEQADPQAKGHWQNDEFVLTSALDAAALETFFLDTYRPTPLLAPWGGRSGFYGGSSEKAAREALESITESRLERLASFRAAIVEVRSLLDRLGMTEKPGDDQAKLRLLRACRAELPDDLLPWLDACYVLTGDDRAFPPLLGTGGNEGSGSYVSGFAQLVIACLIERKHDDALAAALFGLARPGTGSNQTPGQFAPLAAGGPNATSGFEGGTVLNPWDYLLCLEGTLLFAAAATKRLEASSSAGLAFPFTVRAVGAGAGSVALRDEPNARAETWFPLWGRPASLPELSSIFAEGRVQVSGRTARDALDFARAISSLGVQRGLTSFQRYGYLQRFGRNVVAVPLDRIDVRENPSGALIDELEQAHGDWLASFRRLARQGDPAPPARLVSLVARLEDTLFELTSAWYAGRVQAVLIALGEAQAYLSRSPTAREKVLPVPLLSERWLREADDRSMEFRLAAGLASLRAEVRVSDGTTRSVLPMAVHFAPIDERRRWLEGAEREVTWGPGSLSDNLAALAVRRLLAAERSNVVDTPWMSRAPVPLGAVGAWLAGEIDESRVASLLQGTVLARVPSDLPPVRFTDRPIPPAYAVLKPIFSPSHQLRRAGLLADSGSNSGEGGSGTTKDAARIARLLEADRVHDAVEIGIRRLRVNRIPVPPVLAEAAHPRGRLLLSALVAPIGVGALRNVVSRVMLETKEREDTLASETET